jgi:hypothetical protein
MRTLRLLNLHYSKTDDDNTNTNTNVKQAIDYNKKAINTTDDNNNSNKPVKVKRLVYYL